MRNFIGKTIDAIRKRQFQISVWRNFLHARKKMLASDDLNQFEKQLLQTVSLEIHPRDTMYAGANANHYLMVGLSAIRCIDAVLKGRLNPSGINTILDFPCGFGRVLRFLKVRFPRTDITASEIDPDALAFCAQTFGANAIPSAANLKIIQLKSRFDLIWCGSLITHLNRNATKNLLNLFQRHLSPSGLCVFTTHGKTSVRWLNSGSKTYGLDPKSRQRLVTDFEQSGYGYVDYENQTGYGISVVSREHMYALIYDVSSCKTINFIDGGWDNHQDVYAFSLT